LDWIFFFIFEKKSSNFFLLIFQTFGDKKIK